MNREQEWYEDVRNMIPMYSPVCDMCFENIDRDQYINQYNQNGVYCKKCWNWIHLKKWKCTVCNCKGSIRSERNLLKTCCDKEVLWLV